ncbi:VOC family protein [Synechococcus sp. RSCCF101]|uniref:VOC family protein n=1 Tax=Synechococcus sp. RSCCF101 TaxID=2511069 RepID=UPI001248423C|nr:VOC family protein [Synechococcus sp. RSCCF101]QEY31833.1 VOC family protein [Synechococcus sp. RSCCF101]
MPSTADQRGAAVACGWVLAAAQPAALAAFYARLLRVQATQGASERHWRLRLTSGALLQIYRPSRRRGDLPPADGRLAMVLTRESPPGAELERLEAWRLEAADLGADLSEAARREVFGAEAWIRDPEGNRVLLLVTPPGSVAASA